MTAPQHSGVTPDVSIVVISYNDAARLPTAIASAQRQTLANLEIIVVDDASTDDTATVVAAIAQADPRVRYERLAANSGGCSAPRNRGIELARAPWLMFCDSDDELERHAAKNLLLAAEEYDADVVCGATYRQNPVSRTGRRWHADLHEERRVLDGLAQWPELLADTISVDKIYRASFVREHALRFPEGILYEDQLFTLQAMALARRIVVIPETVYLWNVAAGEASITRSRAQARNVESRVAVNRLIDAFLARHDDPVITAAKQRKFYEHDLRLYLDTVRVVDDATAQTTLDILRTYVAQQVAAAPEVLALVHPALRVAVAHLIAGGDDTLPCIRAATACVAEGTVGVPIQSRDDHDWWACTHLDSGAVPREWLDVTGLHLLRVPVPSRRYAHTVASSGAGTTVDAWSDLDAAQPPRLQRRRGRRVLDDVAARWTSTTGPTWTWTVDRVPTVAADERLVLVVGALGGENTSDVSAPSGAPSAASRRVSRSRLRKGIRIAWAEGSALAAMGLARILPTRDLVLVESDAGRTCSGAVAAVAQAIHVARPGLPIAWVCGRDAADPPTWARRIERISWAHAWTARRARWCIDDGTMPMDLTVGGTAVGVVPASPVRRIGLDDPSVLTSPAAQQEVKRRGARWRRLIVPSGADAQRAPTAWACAAPAVPVGSLRRARVLALPGDGMRARDSRPLVVWAPEPRDGGVAALIDMRLWADTMGERVRLVAVGVPVPHDLAWCVTSVDDPDTAAALVAQADLVIGDYGDLLVDAAAAGVPIVRYAPDHVTVVDRQHGVYPGLDLLGATVVAQHALHDAVAARTVDLGDARRDQADALAAFAHLHGADAEVDPRAVVDAVLDGQVPR